MENNVVEKFIQWVDQELDTLRRDARCGAGSREMRLNAMRCSITLRTVKRKVEEILLKNNINSVEHV